MDEIRVNPAGRHIRSVCPAMQEQPRQPIQVESLNSEQGRGQRERDDGDEQFHGYTDGRDGRRDLFPENKWEYFRRPFIIPVAMSTEFEQLVREHYQALYRFGLSLSRNAPDACDLTQQTFALWAERGHQLRDTTKVKAWLFTTLYREFLGGRRRAERFPHLQLSETDHELPILPAEQLRRVEGGEVMDALHQVDEVFRIPLTLFYIGDSSYADIAEILDIPAGTVMSRISRGKQQLRTLLLGLTAEQSQHDRQRTREVRTHE